MSLTVKGIPNPPHLLGGYTVAIDNKKFWRIQASRLGTRFYLELPYFPAESGAENIMDLYTIRNLKTYTFESWIEKD